MKLLFTTLLLGFILIGYSQSNTDLKAHYEAFYKEMKKQGDTRGAIDALTHLNVIEPNTARKDTLAYLYLSDGKYMQALNTIGVEKNATNSDINVEVKAIALKNLNQPKLALEHFEVLFKRKPNPYLAYEMADMKIQVNDLAGAKSNIQYGLANVKDDMKRAFYETQQPYETSLKAALLYLNGLVVFSENRETNLDGALKFMNDALALDANFNMAKLTRDRLEQVKASKATKK